MAEQANAVVAEERRQYVRDLTKRVLAGDEDALSRVREEFDRDPRLWERFSWAHRVRQRMIVQCAGGPLGPEAVEREMALLEQELAGPNPSPLERLLAERATAAWLFCQHADYYAAHALTGLGLEAGSTFYMRCQEAAHKRLLSSIKTLALVRKLALPVLQVNVAQQQVNVAGQVNARGVTCQAHRGNAAPRTAER